MVPPRAPSLRPHEGRLRRMGRPRRGRPDRRRRGRRLGRREDPRGRPGGRARRRRALRRLRDRAGLRELPFPPGVRRVRRLRRRPPLLVLDRPPRGPQAAARARRHARDRDGGRPRVPALGDHDGGRLQLLRRVRGGRRRDRPAGSRLPRGVRPRRDGAGALRDAPRSRRARPLRPCPSRRVAARAVHVHPRGVRGVRTARASHWRRTSPRAWPSGSSLRTARATGRRSRRCSCRRRAPPGSACSARPACSGLG